MYPPTGMRRKRRFRRSGFTLTELLIVIALGAVLSALTAAATMAVLGRQKITNTEWVLKTLHTAVDQHWRAVIEAAQTEPPSNAAIALAAVQGQSSTDDRRVRVIHIKLRLKQEFPMNFTEAFANPSYAADLAALGITAGNNPPRIGANPGEATEASVCLYLALQKKRKGVSFDVSSLGANTTDGVYKDPRNGPIVVKQFVDGWGTAIRFFRWPTGNAEVDALNPAPSTDVRYQTFRDPLDRDGLLMNTAWWSGAQRGIFENTLHSVSNATGTAPQSFFVLPVIASAGPNHQFEIAMPGTATAVDPMTPNSLASDDVYSYRLLSLGARGG